jgi:hypothetical protein
MYYFNADARDGGASNISACNTCCCHSIFLRPGETGMVAVNYAPWVLPIAPPGIIPGGTEYTVTLDDSACALGLVDGFLPPNNSNYLLTTPVNTPKTIDLSLNATPAGNDARYDPVPLAGPHHGTIAQATDGSNIITYTPAGGYTGFDYFSYKMTDAQGRSIVRSVRLSVGFHSQLPDVGYMSALPYIDLRRTKVNQAQFTLQFPVTMPLRCQPCESYKLIVQQSAKDCEGNLYQHRICFDLSCKDCG